MVRNIRRNTARKLRVQTNQILETSIRQRAIVRILGLVGVILENLLEPSHVACVDLENLCCY